MTVMWGRELITVILEVPLSSMYIAIVLWLLKLQGCCWYLLFFRVEEVWLHDYKTWRKERNTGQAIFVILMDDWCCETYSIGKAVFQIWSVQCIHTAGHSSPLSSSKFTSPHKGDPVPIKQSHSICSQVPGSHGNLLSVTMDLPILDIFYAGTHITCDRLCLISFS